MSDVPTPTAESTRKRTELPGVATKSDSGVGTGTGAGGAESPHLTGAVNVGDLLTRARALKDECYAAWSTEPRRALEAAHALRALCAREPESQAAREIGALADWADGIAHVTQGRMAEAVQSLDASAGAFRDIGRGDQAALTQVPKIMALSMLGQYDAAIECAEDAQRDFVVQGNTLGAAKVGHNLGILYERRGHYTQATAHARRASVLFARAGDREGSVQADIALANALTSLGDFDEALRIYARARMRATTHGHPLLESLVDESVGLLQLDRGRYREALRGLESTRRSYEKLALPRHLAIAEKQLADAYLELRLLPEALALYDKVLERLHALGFADEQAWALARRGRVQALLGRKSAAIESFEHACTLFVERGIAVGEATVMLARAELELDGGNPAVATKLSAHAGEVFDAAGRIAERVRCDVVRAHALLRSGSAEQAAALFSSTGALAHTMRMPSIRVRCRVGQGLAAQAMGDANAARAAYVDAVEHFESIRRALPGDDLRSAFLTDHLLPFRELTRLALEAHAAAPSSATAAAVLEQLDRMRARSLADRLSGAGAPAADARTRALRERLNWLHRHVHRLDTDEDPTAALKDELRRTERELLERARRARLADDETRGRTGDEDGFDLSALRECLGTGDALVEYGVLDDELFACIITADGVAVERQLASWLEVQDALRGVRFQIETLRHGAMPVQQHVASLSLRVHKRLERVHALVWQPLAAHLARRKRVLIVPCGALASLPFAALPITASNAALPVGPQVLADRFALALVPSARTAWHGLRRTPAAARHVVALGESSRLPHAAVEANEVAAMFESGTALVGDEATVARLEAHAPLADVLHLACHAQFRSDNPMFSALHMRDAALGVEAVEQWSLRPCTVVLSACDTGLAAGGDGEEHVGLVRAFLSAGAARVMATLWPVDDATTAAFMRDFYAALREGRSAAQALRDAQLRRRAEQPHPFFWSAFALHGGW